MPLTWNITKDEVARVKAYVASRAEDGLVKYRIKRNLTHRPSSLTRADVWHAQLYCLLTTQQKSGPTAPVTKFINLDPFPLSLDKCQASADVRNLVLETTSNYGGSFR